MFSEVLSCWLSAEQRTLIFSDDRAGTRRWPTREARLRAERELEARLEALERRFGKDGG